MWRLDSSIDQAAPRTGMPAALGAAAWAAAAWAAAAWAAATVRTRHSNPNCSGRCQHTSLLCSTKDSCLHRGCGSNCNTKRCATLDHAHAHAHAMQLTRTCHAHAHAHAHVQCVWLRGSNGDHSLPFRVSEPILCPSILVPILILNAAPPLASLALFSLGHIFIIVKPIANELPVLALPRVAR
jgi:hypothetical protein